MPGDLLIAIVDDDAFAREATVDLVRALGFSASGFGSAAEFLESEDRSKVACVIADVRMPGLGGLDLHLALSRSGRPIPTLLMTAYPDERLRARAIEAGVKVFIAKPLEADELLAGIRSAVAHSGRSGDDGPLNR